MHFQPRSLCERMDTTMPNQPKPMQDPAMKQYFDTLPKNVQETIVQSGVEVSSLEQLKQCAQHFMQKNG